MKTTPIHAGPPADSRTREAVLVAVVAAALLTIAQALLVHVGRVHGDDEIYTRMAEHPFATHTFPFAYRVAVPAIVHVLPFPHHVSFLWLTILCAGAGAGFLFALLAVLGCRRDLAWGLCVLFAVSPVVLLAALRGGRSVDPASLLVMNAAALFIVRRRVWALAITLLLGAFVRESAMFLIPFAYAVWADRLVDRDALRRTVAIGVPAAAVYVALRLAIPTVGREQVIGYAGGFFDERWHVLRSALDGTQLELRRTFLAFGPLWVVAPFALWSMSYARRSLVLVALCAVGATYALDWERVFVLATPAFYPAAAYVVNHRVMLRRLVLVAWLAVVVAYAVDLQRGGITKIDQLAPSTYPVR